jgi:hypothetical protein
MEITQIIVAIIVAVPGLVALFSGWSKSRAESSDIITQAAERAVTVVQKQLDAICRDFDELDAKYRQLRIEHDELSNEVDTLIAGANILHAQVIEGGGQPRYNPPNRRKEIR